MELFHAKEVLGGGGMRWRWRVLRSPWGPRWMRRSSRMDRIPHLPSCAMAPGVFAYWGWGRPFRSAKGTMSDGVGREVLGGGFGHGGSLDLPPRRRVDVGRARALWLVVSLRSTGCSGGTSVMGVVDGAVFATVSGGLGGFVRLFEVTGSTGATGRTGAGGGAWALGGAAWVGGLGGVGNMEGLGGGVGSFLFLAVGGGDMVSTARLGCVAEGLSSTGGLSLWAG